MTSASLHRTHRIVVGVDGSAHAQRALEWAVEEARLRALPVCLVHGWFAASVGSDPTGMAYGALEDAGRSLLDDARAKAAHQAPDVAIDAVLVAESPVTALLTEADDADLLVVGARGHGGFAGLVLGSVTDQVVRHATCPVVVVR